jgi:outer membrane lipase/esterase
MGDFVMRNPRLPAAWARSAVFATALTFAVAGHAPSTVAEDKYQRLFVFGDSYADLTLSDKPASNPLAPPLVSIPLWRVYPASLKDNLRIPEILDYAVGGATVREGGNAVIPPNLNLPDQVDGFSTIEGRSFGPRDLVTLSIGGNDFLQFFATSGQTPEAFGKATADAVGKEIGKLVDAGARTFVIAGFSGMSNLGANVIPDGAAEVAADAYAVTYFNGLQAKLVPLAQDGVRFFMLDLFKLGRQAVTDPRYGFTVTEFDKDGRPIASRCPSFAVCPVNSPDNTGGVKYLLGPDGLHLTSDGFKLVADYMANIVMAPDTIAVQSAIVTTTTSGFVGSLLDRLGGVRQLSSVPGVVVADPDGPMGLGHRQRQGRAGPASRFTTFAMGTFLGGSRDEAFASAGYEYDATSGTAGIEYSVNRNLIVGLAGNYTTAQADLTSDANINIDAVQAAAYLSYATRNAFADALVAYGSHDLGLTRPGVIDSVRSSTDASALALAARTGYLFDFGRLRAGPIAGLTYVHTRVGGYTERGDPLLTFKVEEQTVDSLTGNVGLRFLAPFRAGGGVVIPYLNVTLEHQFGDATHTLTTTLTQAPLLPILSPVTTFDTRTYGLVEGGITFQLGGDLSATIAGSSTFARDEGEDYRVSAGLNLRF